MSFVYLVARKKVLLWFPGFFRVFPGFFRDLVVLAFCVQGCSESARGTAETEDEDDDGKGTRTPHTG